MIAIRPVRRAALGVRRGLAAVAAGTLLTALPGCGADLAPSSAGHAVARKVRASPSRTRTAHPAPARSTPRGKPSPAKRTAKPKPRTSAPTTAPVLPSDDQGRAYDLGTIVSVDTVRHVPVLVFDRWSVRGRSDAEIADQGYPMARHTSQPFYDANPAATYRVPVAQHAQFVAQTCLSIDQPLKRSATTLNGLRAMTGPGTVVLLSLDGNGQVTKIANDPRCAP